MPVSKKPSKQPRMVHSKGGAHHIRSPALCKHPEAVEADAGWCCIARPRAMSPPPSRRTLLHVSCGRRRLDSEVNEKHDRGKVRRKGRQSSGGVLKTGELAALIKQGFNGSVAVEKSGGAGSPLRLRLSPGKVSPLVEQTSGSITISSHNTRLMSTLQNAQRWSPSSHPDLKSPTEMTKCSSSLLDMMVHEHQLPLKQSSQAILSLPNFQSSQETNLILVDASSGSQFNDSSTSDVKLTLSTRDGTRVTVSVHKHVLSSRSKYFATKFSERATKYLYASPQAVDIYDCEDVDIYLQTLKLMYGKDMKRMMTRETVSRVLGILKVSASLIFETGIVSCLEFLEAAPWTEDEEEQIASLVSQLQLTDCATADILTRLSTADLNSKEDILAELLDSVTKGTDEKARREMKALISRMLRENAVKKDDMDDSQHIFYNACFNSIDMLIQLFRKTLNVDIGSKDGSDDKALLIAQISRQSDTLHWLTDLMIDQQIADDFVQIWAKQGELAALHKQIPTIFRYEVSRVTARLCIGIGKGQLLLSKDVRFLLLQTWFQPLLDDFGWLHRCCKGLDKKLVEEGISQTILTLPLKQQQTILLGWFDCFSSHGDDCPNLEKGFEVWWRRTFLKPLDSPTQITLEV